jgi:cysteine desulfurase / selenocysteine lyase
MNQSEPTVARPDVSSPPLDPEAFDLEPGILWIMHCSEGPVPKASAAAIRDFLGRETQPWKLGWERDFIGLPQRVRRGAAALLGAREEDLTLTQTTSSGLAAIAQGFPWRKGDEVVAPLGEFPSNAWPWKTLAARGVTLREVPLWPGHHAGATAWESAPPTIDSRPEDRLLAALGPKSRILTVSWVRFQDGLKLDLERLARGCGERGVALVVDGIQGAGTQALPPLEGLQGGRSGLVAFATGGHKGLLAPQGLGLLWTAPEFRDSLAPPGGWLGVEEATNFDRPSTDLERGWAADGSRLELGVPNLVGCAALAESLALIEGAGGAAAVATHVDALTVHFLAGLGALPRWREEAERLEALRAAGRLGAILGLHHGEVGLDGLNALLRSAFDAGIYPSVREGYLRIAFHGFHTGENVQRVLEWLGRA